MPPAAAPCASRRSAAASGSTGNYCYNRKLPVTGTSLIVSTAVQVDPEPRRTVPLASEARIVTDGKFLRLGEERFLVKGVTYGTFAPDGDGYQFPSPAQIAEDFRLMAELGINTVRTYTAPRRDLLDEAARNGLRVMVGLPWPEHVAFLDDRKLAHGIRHDIVRQARMIGGHPPVLMIAVATEPPL